MNFNKLIVAFVIVLIVFLSISYLSYPLLSPDSGFYLATAREFYSGKVYFVDIAIAYNPLAIVIIGLPFLFSNHPDPRVSLLLNMFVIWMSAYVLFSILKTINKNKKECLFYALFFVLVSLLLDGSHLMLEPISVFFQLIGLNFYRIHKNTEKNQFLIYTGIAIALSFLSKQYGLFILAPIGIDILINKNDVLKKTALMAFGFLIPIALFFAYLGSNGVGIFDFLKHILGIVELDKGNGTGTNYNLITFSIGFVIFIVYNLYVLLIPILLIKNKKQLQLKNSLFISILPFSLLVLLSASYAHYFQYVLPYTLIAFVYLMNISKSKINKFSTFAFAFSVMFMTVFSIISFTRKQNKINLQEESIKQLTSIIPKNSKVYLDGISPAFYYLCDFQSLQLNKLGFTFPGYFYPKTIVNLMDSNSYLVVSADALPNYKSLLTGFSIKEITIQNQVFYTIKKQ